MRLFFVSLVGPALLVGGVAHAQTRPSQDEIACKLGGECVSRQTPTPQPSDSDGSVVIADDERPMCFGGSGCGHGAKPAVVAAHVVTPSRPGAPVNYRAGRASKNTSAHFASASTTTVAAPSASRSGSALDMQLTFPNGSADLNAAARERISDFAQAIARKSSLAALSFRISGHTNAVGTRANNLDLSRRRAEAVVDYMITLGVTKDRLEPQGVGFDDPIPALNPADGANRRVVIVVK